MSKVGFTTSVYGALTRLYPRHFRDEYGADMTRLLSEQCRDESTGRVFVRAVIDAAISIPTQHVEARMRRAPHRLVPVVYFAAAVAGLLVAILGGSEPTSLVLGLGIAISAGAIGIAAWRRSAAAPDTRSFTESWWKFLVAAPLLVALVIVAAGVGVEAWYLGIFTVLAAVLSAALGVVLALAHVFARRPRGSSA